jgi:choice-of-anchor B domain-containing protein
MNKIILLSIALISLQAFAQTPCENGEADGFPCSNIDLMSHFVLGEMGTGSNYNDIWGWTDPASGREFALLGRSDGTSFIEITDPLNPVLIGNLQSHINGETLWRDIKVFNGHAFIVSEQGGHGMQVFDLSELLTVDLPPIDFAETAWYAGFGNAHNIAINEESGYAYGIGSDTFSGSLHIVDISDPLSPVLAGGYGESGYTHDAQIVNYKGPDTDYADREVAFICNGGSGVLIIDVDDKSDCQSISGLTYPNVVYTHQGWLTEDHRYFIVNDEIDELNIDFNTRTHIFNVEDLDEPVYVGYHEHSTYASDHNLYTHEGLAYMSNYRSGLRIMDLTNLASAELTELAYFDVDPGPETPGYSGTWSNYPYFESGNVVVSTFGDFFVVRPNDSVVTTIDETVQPMSLELFPNPATSTLTLKGASNSQDLHLQVFDQAGRQVGHNLLWPAGISNLTVNIDHLSQGAYTIVVSELPHVNLQFVKL